MSQIVDQYGNAFKGAVDTVGGETFTESGRTYTQSMTGSGSEVITDLNGHAVVAIDLNTVALSATIIFEGSVDGTTYRSLTAIDQATNAFIQSIVVTTTHNKTYFVGVSALRRLKIRFSAYTSGSIAAGVRASLADYAINQIPKSAEQYPTATAAVNTASTLTIAAAGAGLFHHITTIQLVKLYSVIGVAAGAGVIITSTNLPGNPAWTTEQLASPAGTATRVLDINFSGNPLKSLTANTATTFVAPAQLQTIWRWDISYYVGP